jgi:hypothetical protein
MLNNNNKSKKKRFEEGSEMKKIINLKRVMSLFLFVATVVILQSCVVYRPSAEQLVTVPDIIQMSKDGLSSKDIIRDIRQSHTAYDLKADQLIKLHEQGVQDSVINYMEDTKTELIQQNQRYAGSSYWWPYDGFYYGGFGWGSPYGMYGWGWGPTIVYSVNRGFGGGYHGGYHGSVGFHGGGGYQGGRRR